MTYEQALEAFLADLEGGLAVEPALARYPAHAATLRQDAAFSRQIGELAGAINLPRGAAERARGRLTADLRDARSRGSRHSRPGLPAPGARGLVYGGALSALVVAGVAVLLLSGALSGLIGGASTAEAAFDGVVLDNQGGTLTVQTSEGVETVTVAVTPPAGNATAAGLQTGAFVSVHGKRLKDGTVSLSRISAVSMEALNDWCDSHSDQCLQLKNRLENEVRACPRSPQACAALTTRLQDLQQKLSVHAGQLLDLEGRCQQGISSACRQLKSFCASHGGLCGHLRPSGSAAAGTLATRLQNLRNACAADASQCPQLQSFCGQRPEACDAVRRELQDLQDSLQKHQPAP
jgi:hypothetical protein